MDKEVDQDRKDYVRNIAANYGRVKLAKHFNITPQNIHMWCKRNSIPARFVVPLELLTGIPCWELRPDIFPPERFESDEIANEILRKRQAIIEAQEATEIEDNVKVAQSIFKTYKETGVCVIKYISNKKVIKFYDKLKNADRT